MVGFILGWTALTLLAAMWRRRIVRSQGPRHLDMTAPLTRRLRGMTRLGTVQAARIYFLTEMILV